MSLGKNILMGIIGEMYRSGVEIDVLNVSDPIQQQLYLTLPKESFTYNNGKIVHDAASYARRIKETWIEMGILRDNASVKYKTKDIIWNKEMGEDNFNKHRDDIINLIFPMK